MTLRRSKLLIESMLTASVDPARRERQLSLLDLALKLRADDSMSVALFRSLTLAHFSIELSRFLLGHRS